MSDKGLLIIISGFSGCGKGTVVNRLVGDCPDEYALSVSSTTRSPRPGEKEGVNYFYRTREEFLELIDKGEFLEYAEYVGNYYGTSKSFVEQKLDEGINVILEIEFQGALKVREKMPDTVMIFIIPPSVAELERRLVGRNTEGIEIVHSRMEQALLEAKSIEKYDYLIINDTVEQCVEDIKAVVSSVKFHTVGNHEKIKTIKRELEQYLKGKGE